ncbi:uncharacterized protein PG986_008338 [Apiospora aurea]|uniref:Uncharacterized protein n=1 Tax=Apiospora aurea TaxID=335848 RepID=A0ABR1QF61_9PEZI
MVSPSSSSPSSSSSSTAASKKPQVLSSGQTTNSTPNQQQTGNVDLSGSTLARDFAGGLEAPNNEHSPLLSPVDAGAP